MQCCVVIGDVSSGKTPFIERVLDTFLPRTDVQVAGYTQPKLTDGGERVGYALTVVRQNQTLVTVPFAKSNQNSKPGAIPFTFEDSAFSLLEAEAESFCTNGRPVLLLLDEIGRLETSHCGHFRSISRFVERLRTPSVVVATFNPARRTEAQALLAEVGIPGPLMVIETPLAETEVVKLIDEIASLLFSRCDFAPER
jgi:nucleoside-triphosphatase THEP1